MTADFTGGGDRRRSFELLWGVAEPGRRGPKPRLSVDELVSAAVGLADAEGLAAVSMRRLAESLGVSPMSLYTYVPSKAELLDLMLDRVWGEMQPPPGDGADWRAKLQFIARERWSLSQRHRWLLQVATHRPPLGPNVLASIEASFQALDGLGLTGVEMDQLLHLVTDYVRGAVLQAIEIRDVEERTGMTDEQWWRTNEPLLLGFVDTKDYPTCDRISGELEAAYSNGVDPAAIFEFGLQRLLDGIGVYIAGRNPPTPA
jgi:AcrR family transcriptional regulator